ncbi:helix-turn-helix domain-containing protein [Staphylococcus arlettae]|uniref:helix-turn-helix domain-containing protein n=1 Tax=Staphylococcus arlettae TaxID=29378 RepID=UPI001E2FE19D|nr:helix-turn-helix domain-containing protein [Staphylococcus arlettae]MCD8906460.1 helix-turn-helix domain-containing protein [Staphylococcus arlettae]
MYNILNFVHSQAHDYKTQKSIFNIITGKKSHQTFFDASSQHLLSFYHSLPNLKYHSFERILTETNDNHTNLTLKCNNKHTYDSMRNTFNALQLLIQTISCDIHKFYQFTPVSQQLQVQKQVKKLFNTIKKQQETDNFLAELQQLLTAIHDTNGKTYIHYYLQGYNESMYTRQQVSLIENIPQHLLMELEYNDLVEMVTQLENNSKYPLLHQLVLRPPLLNKTEQTLHSILAQQSLNDILREQNVKINTIEDHLIELFIKGYLSDYETYVITQMMGDFSHYYPEHSNERLRDMKARFSDLSYFQLKLLIVGYQRGELNAT